MCGWAVDVWAFENSMVTRMYEDPVSFPYHTQLSRPTQSHVFVNCYGCDPHSTRHVYMYLFSGRVKSQRRLF